MKPAAALLAAAIAAAAPAPARACSISLVLAVDVSGSVDPDEHLLQVGGLAAAFRDSGVIETISNLPGGAAVTVMQWSGAPHQLQTTPWALLTDAASARAFAKEIDVAPRAFRIYSTAIGNALEAAAALVETSPYRCGRRVIDISGDGVNNEGQAPIRVSRRLSARDIMVNGLVIKGADPDPEPHYREQVITGPGSFVEVAQGFADFARAIRRKLIRELSPRHTALEPPRRLASLLDRQPERKGGRASASPFLPPRFAGD